MRAVVPLLTLLAIVGVALIATSSQSAPYASHASRGPVRIRATSAGAVPQDDVERRDTLGTREERPARADSAAKRRRAATHRAP